MRVRNNVFRLSNKFLGKKVLGKKGWQIARTNGADNEGNNGGL